MGEVGRPIKQGFEYFQLYCDFFTNEKIKALRRARGEIGILTYINLLCRIYRTGGYYYRCRDLDDLASDIAEQITNDRFQRTKTRVRESISYLISHEILDRDLAEQGIITGIAMQERYVEMAYRAKRKINIDTYCLIDVDAVMRKKNISSEEIPLSSEETAVHSEETGQSKSKRKNTTTTAISIARARENEPAEMNVPTLYEVAAYFRDDLELVSSLESRNEAERFVLYNEKRGWDCLPNWHNAAKLWITRMR